MVVVPIPCKIYVMRVFNARYLEMNTHNLALSRSLEKTSLSKVFSRGVVSSPFFQAK